MYPRQKNHVRGKGRATDLRLVFSCLYVERALEKSTQLMRTAGLSICPAAVARASVGNVWSLLVDPAAFTRWSDTVVESIMPPGRAHAGQVIMLRTPRRGRWFHVRFVVESV